MKKISLLSFLLLTTASCFGMDKKNSEKNLLFIPSIFEFQSNSEKIEALEAQIKKEKEIFDIMIGKNGGKRIDPLPKPGFPDYPVNILCQIDKMRRLSEEVEQLRKLESEIAKKE
jgi:hypothetical protein